MTFAKMQDTMRECGLLYLGWVDGAVQYIPNSITRQDATMLADAVNDTGTIRAALYELWLITKKERMLPEDRDAMLMIYARRLREALVRKTVRPGATTNVILFPRKNPNADKFSRSGS
jgi:hypothetical protein